MGGFGWEVPFMTVVGGICGYVIIYPLALLTRFKRLRYRVDLAQAISIGMTSLIAVVLLTGYFVASFDRIIAGRFLVLSGLPAAAILGMLGHSRVVSYPRRAHYTKNGLILGSLAIVACDIAALYFQIPSI